MLVAEDEVDMAEAPRWGELPLLSLHHVPLDSLPAKVSKLGKHPTKCIDQPGNEL